MPVLLFLVLSVGVSILALPLGIEYYGLGFLAGGALTAVAGLFYLYRYLKKLEYQVFCRQPLFYEEPNGVFKRIADYIEEKEKSSLVSQYSVGRRKRRKKGEEQE